MWGLAGVSTWKERPEKGRAWWGEPTAGARGPEGAHEGAGGLRVGPPGRRCAHHRADSASVPSIRTPPCTQRGHGPTGPRATSPAWAGLCPEGCGVHLGGLLASGGPGQREGPALLGNLCPCRRPAEGVGHLGLHVRLYGPKLRQSELATPGTPSVAGITFRRLGPREPWAAAWLEPDMQSCWPKAWRGQALGPRPTHPPGPRQVPGLDSSL